jgi:hypothetical protein
MIKDEKHEIKTWSFNDAVIYVTGTSHIVIPEPVDGRSYKESTELLSVIPVSGYYMVEEKQKLLERVNKVCDALAELFSEEQDQEINISYEINAHQYVNC